LRESKLAQRIGVPQIGGELRAICLIDARSGSLTGAAIWTEEYAADSARVLGRLDHALDEQWPIVIAAGAAEKDQVAIAVDVVRDAHSRLEFGVVRVTVMAVRNIVFRIDTPGLPALIVAKGVGDCVGRDVIVVVVVRFYVPPQAIVDRPVLIRLPLVLRVQPEEYVVGIQRRAGRGIDLGCVWLFRKRVERCRRGYGVKVIIAPIE
jgi:hypothetical protein